MRATGYISARPGQAAQVHGESSNMMMVHAWHACTACVNVLDTGHRNDLSVQGISPIQLRGNQESQPGLSSAGAGMCWHGGQADCAIR
eukprot:323697-Chlamydomonas_euryale.AAC.10